MRPASRGCLLLMLCAAPLWAQSGVRAPHIGYVYPSGGQQGTTIEATAGGQYLRGCNHVFISGRGVTGEIIEHVMPLRNNQIGDAFRHIRVLTRERYAELAGKPKPERKGQDLELPELPDHPWLRGLEDKSLEQLQDLSALLRDPKRQPNAQIEEWVLLKLTIFPDAPVSDREIRLLTPGGGLTNPLIFQVGNLPEVNEVEQIPGKKIELPLLESPILLNGQIMPGDIDHFRIQGTKGQHLVIQAHARRLIPYLADAVPGWFQATMALYDATGKELAFADDYQFDPDPVLLFAIPADGEFTIEIRDSIYRGREDFVYRITVAEQPFITGMFPLGGPTGYPTLAGIVGWNLPSDRVTLDTEHNGIGLQRAVAHWGDWYSNEIWYAVDTLPEADEVEPNNTSSNAQRVDMPLIVNGQILTSDDVDIFTFLGRAKQDIVIEVRARQLRSPLDSVLRLTGPDGKMLAWNDDVEQQNLGLVTHHADSYVKVTLPTAGLYQVQLSDAQHHGGPAYAYRLRIGEPQPDFSLLVTPASINLPAGRGIPITVHALKTDGFDEDIFIGLRNAPDGFKLAGEWIPKGRTNARITLISPPRPLTVPVALEFVGRARINDVTVTRPALSAEDQMQAFLYRHLVPFRYCVASTSRTPGIVAAVQLPGGRPIRLPAGGSAQVVVKTTQLGSLEELSLELSNPPKGITVGELSAVKDGVAIELKSDAEQVGPGYADNLIVEVFRQTTTGGQDGQPKRTRRYSMGYLPAIPFQVGRP